jgi:hypothetical protein
MTLTKDYLIMTIVDRILEQMSVKDMMAYVEDTLYHSFEDWTEPDLLDYISSEWPEEG